MTDPKSGYFCVYNLTASSNDDIVEALNRGQYENPPSQKQWWSQQEPIENRKVSAIVAHHRQSPGVLDKQYFVICDRPDWATSGVLAINLNFLGWEDAVRMEVGVAGDAIPSNSISNTEWEENLGASGGTWPGDRFAVYVTAQGTKDPQALMSALNAGLGGRKAWTMGGPVCRDATTLLPSDSSVDLATIAKLHTSIADREGFDPAMFIVSDDEEWESVGVSIVRTRGQDIEDVSAKPVDCSAEILTWVDQGLYTWEEAKSWNSQQ